MRLLCVAQRIYVQYESIELGFLHLAAHELPEVAGLESEKELTNNRDLRHVIANVVIVLHNIALRVRELLVLFLKENNLFGDLIQYYLQERRKHFFDVFLLVSDLIFAQPSACELLPFQLISLCSAGTHE